MTRPDWMTMPEIAAALGVHPGTVRVWIWRGYLASDLRKDPDGPGVTRHWVRRSDLRAFVERHYLGKPRPPWLDEPD